MTLQERIDAAKKDNRPLSGHSAKQSAPQTATKAPGLSGGPTGAGQGTGGGTAGKSLQERINAAKRDSRPLGWQGTDTTEGKLNATPIARPTDPLRSRTTSLVQSLSTPLTEQMQNNEGAKLRRMDELERQLKQTETEKRLLDLETPYGAAKLPKGWSDPGGVNRRGDELTKKQSDLQNELDALEMERRNRQYEALRTNADFAEKSQYISTRKSEEEIEASRGPLSILVPETRRLDYGDITYDYINRDPQAMADQSLSDVKAGLSAAGLDDSERLEMNRDEIALFNYIYATKSPEAAYQYVKDLTSELNDRQRRTEMTQWGKYASEHPVQSSAFSVLTSPARGLSYLGQAADYLSDGEIDQNAGYNKFSYIPSAIRGQVSQDVEKYWVDRGHEFGGKAASFLYQTGMSMGDFLLNSLVTGALGGEALLGEAGAKKAANLTLAIMGTGAAADATIAAKDRNLSDDQAFILGTIAGLAEVVTEKVSLEALLKPNWEKGVLNYIIKNAVAEGSEEVASDLINLVADVLVSKDKSEWAKSIQAYMDDGNSEAEATGKAVIDQLLSMGLDFLGGALSGGIMSGLAGAGHVMTNYKSGRQLNALDLSGEDIQAFVNEGLASDPSTQAYKLATAAQQKLAAGGTLTNYELGNLYQANIRAVAAEAETGGDDVTPSPASTGEMPNVEPDAKAALWRAAVEMDRADATETADEALSYAQAVTEEAMQAGDEVPVSIDPEGMDIVNRDEMGLVPARGTPDPYGGRAADGSAASPEIGPREGVPSTVAPAAQTAQQVQRQAPVETDIREGTIAFGRETVERFTKDLSPALATTLREMYNEYQEPAAYLEDMMRAHKAGSEGVTDPRAVFGPQMESAHITLPQAQAAMLAGRNNGGTEYEQGAEAVRVRNGGQRADGAHPGGQVRQLEGGAGQNQGGDLQGRPADAGAAALAHGRKVTTASLGIGMGSNSDGIYIVNRGADTPATAAARKLARERGLRLTLFVGNNLSIRRKGGTYVSVRGYVSGDRVFIRADHPEFTADQIMRHEAGHNMIAKGEVDPDMVRERISEKFGTEKADRLAGLYEAAYRGTGLTSSEVWEETVCDSLGDMNIFSETVHEGEVQEFLDEVKKAASAEQETKRNRGPPQETEGKASQELKRPKLSKQEWRQVQSAQMQKYAGMDESSIPETGYVFAHDKFYLLRNYGIGEFEVTMRLNPAKKQHTINRIMEEVDYGYDGQFGEISRAIDGEYPGNEGRRSGYRPSTGDRGERPGVLPVVQGSEAGPDAAGMLREGGGDQDGQRPGPGGVTGKFSMELPVEETKDLLAMHNLTEDKLLKSLGLGGFPMPSIAVTKADIPHTNFGDITLVMDKTTIDPKFDRRNRVYSADAWTPTFPITEYEVDDNRLRKVEQELSALSGRIGGGMFQNSSFIRSLGIEGSSTMDLDALAKRVARDDTARAAYLAEQGQTLEPVQRTKQWSEKLDNAVLQSFIDKIGVRGLAKANADRLAGGSLDELVNAAKPHLAEAIMESYEPVSAPGRTMTEEVRQKRKLEFANAQLQSPFAVEDAVRAASDMYQDGGATGGENDLYATRDALRSAVDDDTVAAWVKGKLEGVIGEAGVSNGKDPYTPSGNRRSFKATHVPATLENIAKVMISEGHGDNRNVGGFYGVKSLRASMAQRFSSIEEMHELEGRLQHLTQKEADEISDALGNRLYEIITKANEERDKNLWSNDLLDTDRIGRILMDAARAKHITIDSIMAEFDKTPYKVSATVAKEMRDLLFDISQMPVNIFEAKPERPVHFDEVLAAVIPDTSSDELRTRLEDAGVTVLDYKAGDDADRLAKVNSVEGAKFSQELEGIEELRRENEELKASLDEFRGIAKTAERRTAQAAYWKGQTKLTTPEALTVRQGDVAKLARELTTGWGSTMAPKEIVQDLTKVGEYLLRGEKGSGEIDTRTLWELAQPIGRALVETAQERTNDLYEQYADLRSYLREVPLIISEADSHDIPDFQDFRKRNFGRMRIKKGESSNIDTLYKEMSSSWPEFFSETEENTAGDMLLKMEEVLDQLSPVYENPYSGDMADATRAATNAVIDGMLGESVRQQAPTFADRQARKLEQAVAKGKQAVARERVKRNEQVQRIREHYAEMRQRQAERKADIKARTRLLHIAQRLQNKKLPAVNRVRLDQYIGELDTVAKSMTGTTLAKLNELQDWYNGVTNKESPTYDPDFIPDEATKRKLERLSKRQINDLSAQEVADLTEALLNIENELRTEKKLIDTQDRRDVYAMGTEVIRDLENVKGSKAMGVSGAIDRFIVTETLSPLRQVRRMTGYVDTDPLYNLTQSLADGQRTMLDYQMRAEKPFEKYASDDAFTRRFSGRQAEGIQVVGLTKDGPVEVTITPAMRASLYLHSLNEQNLRHIKEGGITVPDEKLYRAGKIAEAYDRGETVKLTPSQVRAICESMTAEEKAYALEAERYFNRTSPEAINAVSEKLKGYSIAQVEHYFPINTDTSFTKSDFETIKFDGSIEGMGWTKERINAATPILLRDLDAVLTQSIQQHAKYVGLAIPVRNFNKVWGVTTASYNDDGSRNSYEASVQRAVKKAWGETGYRYIEKMMADLQGSTQAKNALAKALAKVRSNYAGSVLTFNASVAMKQAASYPTAAAVLGWKPLLRAMGDVGKVNLDLIAKYTPLQWYRSKGYSTKELGDINASGSSRFKVLNWMRGKDLPPVLNWVQAMDLLTTRKLWKASEYYIRDTRRDLGIGTDAYYKAVADIYNRVIEETQPNYTTMQRPQLLRSEDNLLANLHMFKTQPFQNFNILYDAAENWAAKVRYAQNGGAQAKQAEAMARRDFGRAVTSQLAQLAVFAAMTAAWALFRGKTKKYEDEDTGEITAESFLAAFGKDMAGGLLSTVPFGSDAWEALSSKMFGDTYYGMDVTTISAITDTFQSFDGLIELVSDVFQSAAAGEEVNWNSARLKLDGYLDDISKAAGVPYENVANLFNAAYRQASIAAQGKYRGEYAALKMTTDPEKYSKDYYDVLYQALQGDRKAYEAIYEDMVSTGTFPEEKVKNAMETRMKNDQGVESADELDRRYLSPEQEKIYDGVLKQVSASSVWRSATEEQRDKAEDILYDLAVGNNAGVNLQEKIDGGAAYGIDEADYVLFRLALSMADQPTESGKMGTYTNDEVEAAIEMLKGLSKDARSYLWTSQGKSEKSNPWK